MDPPSLKWERNVALHSSVILAALPMCVHPVGLVSLGLTLLCCFCSAAWKWPHVSNSSRRWASSGLFQEVDLKLKSLIDSDLHSKSSQHATKRDLHYKMHSRQEEWGHTSVEQLMAIVGLIWGGPLLCHKAGALQKHSATIVRWATAEICLRALQSFWLIDISMKLWKLPLYTNDIWTAFLWTGVTRSELINIAQEVRIQPVTALPVFCYALFPSSAPRFL